MVQDDSSLKKSILFSLWMDWILQLLVKQLMPLAPRHEASNRFGGFLKWVIPPMMDGLSWKKYGKKKAIKVIKVDEN